MNKVFKQLKNEFKKNYKIFILMILLNIIIVYVVLNNKHSLILDNFNIEYKQFLSETKLLDVEYTKILVKNSYLNQYLDNPSYYLSINYLSNILCYIMPFINSLCFIIFFNLEYKNKTYLILINHHQLKRCFYYKMMIIIIVLIINLIFIVMLSSYFQIKTINSINDIISIDNYFNIIDRPFNLNISICILYLVIYIILLINVCSLLYCFNNIFYSIILVSTQILSLILNNKYHISIILNNYCSLIIKENAYTLININYEITKYQYTLYLIILVILLVSIIIHILIVYYKKIKLLNE